MHTAWKATPAQFLHRHAAPLVPSMKASGLAVRASAGPLGAHGLERGVLHLLLLLRLRLLLGERGALVHGLARRALVLVGLALRGAALLDDVGLGRVEPPIRGRAGGHAIALARGRVHHHSTGAVAYLLH